MKLQDASEVDPRTALDIRARWEIWRSFHSLLRSYSALLPLSGGNAAKIQAFESSISVEVGSQYLGFHFDPAAGDCQWRHITAAGVENSGHFDLTLDGLVTFDGKSQDLDHAAIDFLSVLREGTGKLTGREQ